MDIRGTSFRLLGLIHLVNLLLLIGVSGGDIKENAGVKFRIDGTSVSDDDIFPPQRRVADDSLNTMDITSKPVSFSGFRDYISLEIIQHEKVKLVLENGNQEHDTLSAQLHSPDWFPDGLVHYDVFHDNMESIVTVRIDEAKKSSFVFFNIVHVGVLLLLSVLLFVCLYLVVKATKVKKKQRKRKLPCSCQAVNGNQRLHQGSELCADKKTLHYQATVKPGETREGTVADYETNSVVDFVEFDKSSPDVEGSFVQECTRYNPCACSLTDMDEGKGHKGSRSNASKGQGQTDDDWGSCALVPLLTLLGVSFLGLFVLVSVNHQLTNRISSYKDAQRPVLKLTIPKDKHIRKVRSYSANPDLGDFTFSNEGSLSLVTRLQLLDLSYDCRENITACKTHAMCNKASQDGQFRCRCNRGYYLQDLTCKACLTSCPWGHYMSQQCSAETDVVCKPCKLCEGTEYSVAPCTTTQDTICIDVSFPLNKIFTTSTMTETDIMHLNATMSRNVFLEKLKNIKSLDSALFLASNKQEMQFVYERKTGLEVKIEIDETYLVPEYVDLEHNDDFEYVSQIPQFPYNSKMAMQNIRTSFCRHPMPDYYDIWLDINTNSTTAVEEVQCNINNVDGPPCPEGYKDGETFLHPTDMTRECPKLGRKRLFHSGKNKFFCVNNPDILGSVFKMVVKNSVPLDFPSDDCVQFQSQCDGCLSRSVCLRGSQCCKLDCYNHEACRKLFSSSCPKAEPECIQGDFTKYGLLPRYKSIQQEFACHMKLESPKVLYRISYKASIPSMSFDFQTRYKDVLFRNISHQEDGIDTADFLTLHHFTNMHLSNETILRGQNVTSSESSFSLHDLKEPWQFRNPGDFEIETIRDQEYKTKVQFERPFLYNIHNWNDLGCNINATRIYPKQTLYNEAGIPLALPKPTKRGRNFTYEVRRNDSAPKVQFLAEENVSVLSYFREEMKDSKIIASDLQGSVVWRSDIQRWLVSISGNLTSCPGCFTLELFEEVRSKQIVLYDMLINCPQEFYVNFTIERTDVYIRDIFVIVLNDSIMSHKLVLSSIQAPQFFTTPGNDVVPMETTATSPWIPIVAIMAMCCFICLCLLGLYIYIDAKETPFPLSDIPVPKPQLGEGITFLQSMEKTRPKLSLQQKVILTALIILYIVYAILFTFSAIFGMMHLMQGSESGGITIMSNTSEKILNQMHTQLKGMLDYEEKEASRLMKSAQECQGACSAHLKQSILKGVPDVKREFESVLKKVFQSNGSLHTSLKGYIGNRMEVYQQKIDQFISEYNLTIERNLHKIFTTYKLYLPKVAENMWFDFPRDIFLAQQGRYNVKEVLTEFLTWLEIDKIQEIVDVKAILMNKLTTMMPRVNFSSLSDNISMETEYNKFNISTPISWFRFTSSKEEATPSLSQRHLERNREKGDNWIAEFTTDSPFPSEPESTKKENIMEDIRNLLYPVFISVFLILDGFLLVYRFSWLFKSLKQVKTGIEERVPYDSMTRKIHFILTGKDIPRPESSLDNPYDYYKQNKDNIWKDNTELYFQYVNATPKAQEEILRDLLNDKQKNQPVKPVDEVQGNCCVHFVSKFLKLLYRFFISPVFWRFILICAFVLLLCLVTKAVDDLVTMDSAMFLMDTKAMLPILQRQHSITRETMSKYTIYLNTIIAEYNKLLDTEIHILNGVMVEVTEKQVNLLQNLVTDMCNLRGDNSSCVTSSQIGLVAATITSCNFLPLHSQQFTGFHEDMLTQFIQTELSPLVTNLRGVVFFSFYLLLAFAGAMLVCQVIARIIFIYLVKTGHLRTAKIYQLPSTLEWSGQQSFRDEKDHYISQSLIAESCESGVYDLTT